MVECTSVSMSRLSCGTKDKTKKVTFQKVLTSSELQCKHVTCRHVTCRQYNADMPNLQCSKYSALPVFLYQEYIYLYLSLCNDFSFVTIACQCRRAHPRRLTQVHSTCKRCFGDYPRPLWGDSFIDDRNKDIYIKFILF